MLDMDVVQVMLLIALAIVAGVALFRLGIDNRKADARYAATWSTFAVDMPCKLLVRPVTSPKGFLPRHMLQSLFGLGSLPHHNSTVCAYRPPLPPLVAGLPYIGDTFKVLSEGPAGVAAPHLAKHGSVYRCLSACQTRHW